MFTYPRPSCCYSPTANVEPCAKCLAITHAARNDSASAIRFDSSTDEIARIQAEIASHTARAEAAEAKLRARGIAVPDDSGVRDDGTEDIVEAARRAHNSRDTHSPRGHDRADASTRDDGDTDPVEAARRAQNSRNPAAEYARERADAQANGGRTSHVTAMTDAGDDDPITAAKNAMHARNAGR